MPNVVTGDERYNQLCVQLAAEHGFTISNPQLAAAIAPSANDPDKCVCQTGPRAASSTSLKGDISPSSAVSTAGRQSTHRGWTADRPAVPPQIRWADERAADVDARREHRGTELLLDYLV